MDINSYIISILTLISINALLVISLNIAWGLTGLINLGHLAFAGISAYVWTLLVMNAHLPYLVSVFIALVVTGIIAFLLAQITQKITGDQFALITLFFGIVIYTILLNWQTVTRGSLGIPSIPRPFYLKDDFNFFLFVFSILLLTFLFSIKLAASSFGRALQATRDDELAAQALGKNTSILKSKSMVLSSVIGGISGILIAMYIYYIDPDTFYIHELVFILTALIIGGLASFPGSIIGVVVLQIIFELLRQLPLPPDLIGSLRQIIYAIMLLGIIIFRPKGILGKIQLE